MPTIERYYWMGTLVCVLLAAALDLLNGRIPNRLTYSAIMVGLALRGFLGGWRGAWDGLAAGLLGGGVFFLFFLVRGMGAGDVKLMAAVGCWVGMQEVLPVMVTTAIAGGILALAYLLFRKRVGQTLRNMGTLLRYHLTFGLKPHPEINLKDPKAVKIPYAVAIAAGTCYSFAMVFLRGQ
jgi:prepilin peptidase CpaA